MSFGKQRAWGMRGDARERVSEGVAIQKRAALLGGALRRFMSRGPRRAVYIKSGGSLTSSLGGLASLARAWGERGTLPPFPGANDGLKGGDAERRLCIFAGACQEKKEFFFRLRCFRLSVQEKPFRRRFRFSLS